MPTHSNIPTLEPGDLAVLIGQSGTWVGPFEFVRVDPDCADRFLMRAPDDGSLCSVRADMLRVPNVLGTDAVSPASASAAVDAAPGAREPESRPGITAAQRRAIFGLAKRRGLDVDDVRGMTPAGSVSKLSRLEAAELIDRLKGGGGMGAGKARGTASDGQLLRIAALRREIGFSEAEFGEWLSRKFRVGSLAEIRDKGLASRVIGGMVRMRDNLARRRHAGRPPTTGGKRGRRAAGHGTGRVPKRPEFYGATSPNGRGESPAGGQPAGVQTGFDRASKAL